MRALEPGLGAIYQATTRYLDWAASDRQGEENYHGHANLTDRMAGVSIRASAWPEDPDVISTAPGGLMLMMWGRPPQYPVNPVVLLGLAFDLDDMTVRQLRTPVVKALEDRDIPFLPLAFGALGEAQRHAGIAGWGSIELVERVGMNCVIRAFGGRHYISGFDTNENPPLYFMAELPCAVSTHAEGIEALKPQSVKLAEAQGIEVLRQGDMFAIPTRLHNHDLISMGATFGTEVTERVTMMDPQGWTVVFDDFLNTVRQRPATTTTRTVRRRRGLYGTAHTAKELAYLPDGTMFARGSLVHDPRGVLMQAREADHAELKLPGRNWYLIARNTVPVTTEERR